MWVSFTSTYVLSTRCNFINAGQSQTIKPNTRALIALLDTTCNIFFSFEPYKYRLAAHYHLLDKIDESSLEQWSDVSDLFISLFLSRNRRTSSKFYSKSGVNSLFSFENSTDARACVCRCLIVFVFYFNFFYLFGCLSKNHVSVMDQLPVLRSAILLYNVPKSLMRI